MADGIKIPIEVDLKGKALPDIKRELDLVKQSLNDMRRAGLENTEAFKQQLAVGSQLKQRYTELAKEQRNFGEQSKKSASQLLEMGENLTAIGVAVLYGVNQLKSLAKELYNVTKAGLEFDNLYNAFINFNGGVEQANRNLEQFRTAVAGGMNDADLIKFSNTMKSLGYNTLTTTQILDFAERKSDELGTTIEGASDTLLKFFETGKGRGLYQYGIDVGMVNERMSEMTGLTEKQIQGLSGEEQQRLRTAATMDLYGNTLDQINNKQLDNADKLQKVEKGLENVQLWFGRAFGGEVFNSVDRLNQGLRELGIVTEKNKVSTKDFGDALGFAFGKVLPFIAGGGLGVLLSQLDKLARGFNVVKNAVLSFGNAFRNPVSDAFAVSIMKVVNPIIEKFKWLLKAIAKLTGKENLGIGGTIKVATTGGKEYGEFDDYSEMSRVYEEGEEKEKIKEKGTGKNGTNKTLEERVKTIQDIINAIKTSLNLANLENTYNKEFVELQLQELRNNKLLVKSNAEKVAYLEEENNLIRERAKFILGKENVNLFQGDLLTPERSLTTYQGGESFIQSKDIGVKAGEAVAEFSKLTPLAQQISGIFSSMTNALGIGADTFIGKMASGFNVVLGIINTIVSVMQTIQMINSISMFIPFLAGGGYISGAGTGTSDSIPAMLSNGEYVVNANATSKYLPLLSALNGDGRSMGRYANGGIVSGGGMPNITVYFNSALEKKQVVNVMAGLNSAINNQVSRKSI